MKSPWGCRYLPNPVIGSRYPQRLRQAVRSRSPSLCAPRRRATTSTIMASTSRCSILPALRNALSAINDNYLNVQQDIVETFIDHPPLRKLAEPTITPRGKRIPGLKLDHPRQLALMHAVVRFAHIAGGNAFTTAELHPRALAVLGCPARTLHPWLAALRPCKTPGQRARSQASQLPSLSTASAGILDLPYLPEAVRTRLCAIDRRRSQPLLQMLGSTSKSGRNSIASISPSLSRPGTQRPAFPSLRWI